MSTAFIVASFNQINLHVFLVGFNYFKEDSADHHFINSQLADYVSIVEMLVDSCWQIEQTNLVC